MAFRKKEIPVYMFTGLLESGKTEFINQTLGADYFAVRGYTLLISCEEGEVEYDADVLKKNRIITVNVDDISEFTPEWFAKWEQDKRIERAVVEWNGMWNPLELALPDNWPLYQQLTLIDATTFFNYYNNMRFQFVNMLKNAEVIFVNRASRDQDLLNMKRVVKAVNTGAQLVFEGTDHQEIRQDFEEDLPYDLKAPIIDVNEDAFGIWFLDAMDNPGRYDGKKVRLTGMLSRPFGMPKNRIYIGRKAMTCCADDIVYLGYLATGDSVSALSSGQWVTITAKVKIEFQKTYRGEGPVLYVEKTEKAEPIEGYVQFGA